MASGPMTSWQIDEESIGNRTDLIFMGFKITWMLTAALNLKDTCSFEEKLWPN